MSAQRDKFSQFEDAVSSFEEIREITGEPMPSVLAKVLDHLDDVCLGIIARSPFIVLASASSEGYPDISP